MNVCQMCGNPGKCNHSDPHAPNYDSVLLEPAATIQDAVREWAYNFGATCPEREWIASNYDTWERNPHFTGTPGRHPEDEDEQCDLCLERIVCPIHGS